MCVYAHVDLYEYIKSLSSFKPKQLVTLGCEAHSTQEGNRPSRAPCPKVGCEYIRKPTSLNNLWMEYSLEREANFFHCVEYEGGSDLRDEILTI